MLQDLPSLGEDDAEVFQRLRKRSSKSKKKKLSLSLRKLNICSEDETSKQGGDERVTVEFDTQDESDQGLPVNTHGDDAKQSSSVENAENTSVVDDYSVFHSYRELSDVLTTYEIETISKFNMTNIFKGFDVDISLK